MRINEIKRNLRADDEGFLIKDGILYDYEGVSPIVVIPDDVTYIESDAFWSNDIVEAVYIPSSVKEIGEHAFWSCSGLKFVNIEEGLEKINSSVFWSCSGLENVNLPASLNDIEHSVFWAMDELTIHAPSGSYAESFANNNGFSYSSEKHEYKKADRKNLIRASQYEHGEFTEFEIPSNITGIESRAFEYCENLKEITIPSNVEYIGSSAFSYCYSLKNVTIDGCSEIKSSAFEYCNALETVRINNGTNKIGSNAFAYCENLKDIYLSESISNIDKSAFEYCSPDLVLHVPANSYAEEYALSLNIPFDNNI
ncbi:MAG: leucine-rich repeat domain-containing protein [Ruminococcus sp.]|nr:leucine-rich repeat domain-containing protein [Ruminococcus sp.]